MAKRYTDTDKWGKAWFRSAKPKTKLIWFYLVDNCNHAGVYDIDYGLMSFYIGQEIKPKDLDPLADKVTFISDTKLYINDFIEYQQSLVNGLDDLNPKNHCHGSIIKLLKKHGLPRKKNTADLAPSKPLVSPSLAPSKPLARGYSNSNSNCSSSSKVVHGKCDLLDAYLDFKALRKDLKSPLTERAVKIIIKKLCELAKTNNCKKHRPQMIAILEQSIMNGWKSIYELKGGMPKNTAPGSRGR